MRSTARRRSARRVERIRNLKKIYDLDLDSGASHRLREMAPPRRQKARK